MAQGTASKENLERVSLGCSLHLSELPIIGHALKSASIPVQYHDST